MNKRGSPTLSKFFIEAIYNIVNRQLVLCSHGKEGMNFVNNLTVKAKVLGSNIRCNSKLRYIASSM